MADPSGTPSENGERIFYDGRIVGWVDLRLNADAGLSASEANVLCEGLRDAVVGRIERKRIERAKRPPTEETSPDA